MQNYKKINKIIFLKIKQNCCKSGSSLMIADPLWSCVMLLCDPLWLLCGPLRYLVIPPQNNAILAVYATTNYRNRPVQTAASSIGASVLDQGSPTFRLWRAAFISSLAWRANMQYRRLSIIHI